MLGLYGLVAFFCLLALLAVLDGNPDLAAATLLTEIVVVALLRRPAPVGAAPPPRRTRAGGAPGPIPEPGGGPAAGAMTLRTAVPRLLPAALLVGLTTIHLPPR